MAATEVTNARSSGTDSAGEVSKTPAAAQETYKSDSEDEQSRREFLSRFTADDDHRIMRKVDWRFLPLIGFMYLIKQIDFSNAASIKILQPEEPRNVLTELHMSADQYNWIQTIYYVNLASVIRNITRCTNYVQIAYVLFEVPSTLLLKKATPRKWQSRIFFTWGIVVACHAAIQNASGFYALRFLLGAMEAGFFPCLAAQMCSWYRSDEYGRPIMWMFGFQNFSGIIGSLLTYGISYMNGVGGLSAWRWVFLLEGLATMLFAGIIYNVLPDYPKSPRSAKWLTPDEQQYLEYRLTENAPKTNDAAFDKSEIIISLKDPKLIGFTISQFFLNIAGYGLSWQLPTITTSLGFAGLPRNQLLNIPPAAVTVVGIVFSAWFLRRAYIARPIFIHILSTGILVFFTLLCVSVSKGAIYAAVVLGNAFYFVFFVPFWAWRSATLVGTTGTAFTLALQTSIAQVGGVIAPQLFRSKYAYNGYKTSFIICTVSVVLAILSNVWLTYLTWTVENDTKNVRRERIRAERKGKVYTGEDVRLNR
ncbi:unnamed protein product [Clonostachys chloroleuca]|uniref:Major facilitator superfamily (MFS) profile domain-containing protein n=1 Tax=Clonostachys chloroleuca TaxID=1926264 RepID=A0AA35M6S0_9HYPO|nr:unnamed protein product [Clonostachys chloroleuca]